jgi:NADH:ubiquinone oxidoreductase subunit 3 (subunit A)
MIIVGFLLLSSFALVLLLKGVSSLIAEQVSLNREELSPYECGFEHHNVSRIPLSLRYFFLTLLFLLFDLEIVFLLFLPYAVLSNFLPYAVLVSILFIVFLYLSLIYE